MELNLDNISFIPTYNFSEISINDTKIKKNTKEENLFRPFTCEHSATATATPNAYSTQIKISGQLLTGCDLKAHFSAL